MRLEALYDMLAPEERPVVHQILMQVIHDLNGPLSTFAMELYSVERLCAHLMATEPSGEGQAQCAQLVAIAANLAVAAQSLTAYVDRLQHLSTHVSTPQ